MDFIVDVLLAVPRWLFKVLSDLVISTLELVLPDEISSDLVSMLNQIYEVAGWALEMGEFKYGLSMIVTAVIARFIFSLIPFVGK